MEKLLIELKEMKKDAKKLLEWSKLNCHPENIKYDEGVFNGICRAIRLVEGALAKPVNDASALPIPVVMPACEGNCGSNYCDENGCLNQKRVLGEPIDLPEHEA